MECAAVIAGYSEAGGRVYNEADAMPEDNNQNRKSRAVNARDTLMKADQMLQIAFILPAAVFIGWIAGAGLDLWLHQHWIYMAGIMLGIATGFVQIFRMLRELEPKPGNPSKSPRGKNQGPPANNP